MTAKLFKDREVNVIVLVHLMWSEDGPLVELLKRTVDVPILLWCYNPYRTLPDKMTTLELFRSSGSVGILQGSAPMRRMEKSFSFVFGSPGDQKLDCALNEMATVYGAFEGIKKLRIGQIATRCEPMTGTYVDEFRLLSKLGPTLVPISAYRLYETATSLKIETVNEFEL